MTKSRVFTTHAGTEIPTDRESGYWQQFIDPQRAYYNLFDLYRFYRENPETPPMMDNDYNRKAWELAHEATPDI